MTLKVLMDCYKAASEKAPVTSSILLPLQASSGPLVNMHHVRAANLPEHISRLFWTFRLGETQLAQATGSYRCVTQIV